MFADTLKNGKQLTTKNGNFTRKKIKWKTFCYFIISKLKILCIGNTII